MADDKLDLIVKMINEANKEINNELNTINSKLEALSDNTNKLIRSKEIDAVIIDEHYKKLKHEIDVIERLRLLDTSSYYDNCFPELKLFDPEENIFYSFNSYILENEIIYLSASELKDNHEEFEELDDKFEEYFVEVTFDEYEEKYMPLFENKAKGIILITKII